jgi:hypothetical protein
MEVDTGAAVSLISFETYEIHMRDVPLLPSNARIKTYTGEVIKVMGQLNLDVVYNMQQARLPLLVVDGNGPSLFGRNWLRKIKLDWYNICIVRDSELDNLCQKYSNIFKSGLGKYSGPPASIRIKPSAQPKFCKARPVPYALREKIEDAIDQNIAEGIWEPVQYSEWASPLVPILKSSGSVRLCGDYKVTVNQFCESDNYPIPRIEDLYSELAGGKTFSKIDLSQAYFQIPIDESSQAYLTVNTHRGLFKVTRLPMGIHPATGIFQRIINNILQGLTQVTVYLDDILVTGNNEVQHLQNLEAVFKRLSEANLHISKEKCTFMSSSVTYLGHKIDAEGLHPLEEKVIAIRDARAPRDVTELRSFLGLVNHYARFLPHLSTILAPLHSLLQKNTSWKWEKRQQDAFISVKQMLRTDSVLVHFDRTLPILLECDASPYGLGAVLSHRFPDGSERPISFASRSLSPAEKNYSHLEKEGLALIFGVRKFHQYLYGHEFTLATDHKPLTYLFNENKCIPQMASARIIRWAITLSAYQYSITYKKGSLNNCADALSRLPLPTTVKSTPIPRETIFLMNYLNSTPITGEEIRQWTSKDRVLSRVFDWIQTGWPPQCPGADYRPYYARKNELSSFNGCILWGSRVVVPEPGQSYVLQELHESHIGMSRMKSLARNYVWWPGLDNAIENTVKKCHPCQLYCNQPAPAELHPWDWPDSPWSRLHIDHAGEFMGKFFLIVIDAHSKWLEVLPVSNTSSAVTINALQMIFATHGLPNSLVSDNASGFTSHEFEEFCKQNGIDHIRVAPYKAASNGLAERAVQIFKAAFKRMDPKVPLQKRLNKFLFKYRITPQTSTGLSPAELRWNCKLKSHLDLLKPCLSKRVKVKQMKQKMYHDKKIARQQFKVGDPVYVYPGANKTVWLPGIVIEQTGPVSYKVQINGGPMVKRHKDHVRIRYDAEYSDNDTEYDSDKSTQEEPISQSIPFS